MTTDIVVPVLGESVTEATIAKWLKKQGDAVAVDEPIVELETEKATVELGAPNAGVLAEILAAEGQDVAVGAVIGRIQPSDAAHAPEAVPQTERAAQPPAPAAKPAARMPAAPATSPARPAPDLDPGAVRRTAPGNRISADDLRSFLDEPAADAARSGPAARKLLAEHGLAASAVPATGPGGRVTKGDVLAHVASGAAAAPAAAGAAPAARERRVKMTRLRRTIAARLVEAQSTAAILTTFNEIDMSAVIAARARHKDAFEKRHGVRLGFTSFFAKAVVAALREVPEVNGEIAGDEIVFKDYYDLGMAVSAPTGLVVPVIRDCDRKSFAEIEAALADLAERARTGKLSPDEMRGATFTISNGGVFGSLLSTPILNPPQSGILGLHKIEDRPIAKDGEVVIRPMMYVALSYDHRLVDGREAVTFLVRVKQGIEDPERLLLDV